MNDDIIRSLCMLPASDIYYPKTLQRATEQEIEAAVKRMRQEPDGKHKSRILACERELRKRRKKAGGM